MSDIINVVGELELTWSMFWEEIAEARYSCENEYIFKEVCQNIISYYCVNLTPDEILFKN